MLCCVGLVGGAAVGQALGGPWTVIAPVAGFALGLVADMKLMHGHHSRREEPLRPRDAEPDAKAGAPARIPKPAVPDLAKEA